MQQHRIAIVLESHLERSPVDTGYDPAWYAMRQLLAHAGIDEGACHIDYLVPDKVDVRRHKWTSDEVQLNLVALTVRLQAYQPDFILLLDRYGYLLRAFHGDRRSTDDWKGSIVLAAHVVPGVKTMALYAPTRLRLDYGLTGVVRHLLKRVLTESQTLALDVPVDDIAIDLTKDELVARLKDIYDHDRYVATDLEGYPDRISCIGFATGPNTAFVVPFIRSDGTSWWSEEDEIELWRWVKLVLEKPTVGKACHNALYELFCLAWSYGIVIDGLEDDTMVMWFELFCELEKDLGFVTVMLTKHPWYKHERKATDDYTSLRYNGKDCCRTFEVKLAMDGMLKPKQREHYKFNMKLLAPLAYMMLRGIRYDKAEAQRRLAEVQQEIYELQDQINQEAAKSPAKTQLRAFFQALGQGIDEAVEWSGDAGSDQSRLGVGASGTDDDVSAAQSSKLSGSSGDRKDCLRGTKALIPLLTTAFCRAVHKEPREVTETWWQPMRWNGKKWVKAGKRVKERPETQEIHWEGPDEPLSDQAAWLWLKPITKTVTRNVEVEIKTFEDVRRFAKDSCRDAANHAIKLCKRAASDSLSPAQRGELATLLGIHVKISASGRDDDEEGADGTIERGDERDANWYLYEHCKLPKQWIKEGNRNTDRLASDAKAVVLAWMQSGRDEASRDPRALVFARMKRLLTETKALKVEIDSDGRIRASLNLVGTDTHRISCSASPTRTSRLNLQTVTKKHRSLYLADEGCEMGQLDLAGADGWTTASYSKMLGDSTMLEDLRAKLKPAQIVVLMLDQGAAVNAMPRDQLKLLCKDINDEQEWRYFPMKKVVHGSSYKSGKNKVSEGIALDSFKATGRPVYFSPRDCERVQQDCFFVRYPGIKAYQNWVDQQIKQYGQLAASNGFTRLFYGRKDDAATYRKGYAHLPQVYTTYATELAMYRCWSDPENRNEDGSLKVEMLLTVHDSLLTQWRKEITGWARGKQQEWFNNPIQIAHETIVIPASGTYGGSWGEQENNL